MEEQRSVGRTELDLEKLKVTLGVLGFNSYCTLNDNKPVSADISKDEITSNKMFPDFI